MVWRVGNAVMRLDIIVRVVDGTKKVWIKGGAGVGER